jgi:hypothetical protein
MLDLSGVGVAKAVGVGEAARVHRSVHRLPEPHTHKSERAVCKWRRSGGDCMKDVQDNDTCKCRTSGAQVEENALC